MTIFLVGPRGSGKSSVAERLAARLRCAWLDADAELERRAGRSIRTIFAEDGEGAFRQLESDLLQEISGRRDVVVATGGGVVLREDNRERLRTGHVIWLTADATTLHQRIDGDPATRERRPKLADAPDSEGLAEIEQILRQREPLYQAVADHAFDTSSRSPDEIASVIFSLLTTDH